VLLQTPPLQVRPESHGLPEVRHAPPAAPAVRPGTGGRDPHETEPKLQYPPLHATSADMKKSPNQNRFWDVAGAPAPLRDALMDPSEE
jgi:hypothetical protein